MKVLCKYSIPVLAGFAILVNGLFGCGSDSSSASEDEEGVVSSAFGVSLSSGGIVGYSSEIMPSSSAGSQTGSSEAIALSNGVSNSDPASSAITSSASNPVTQGGVSSSSKKSATVATEEVLSAPKKVLDGTCVPQKVVLDKGEMATWKFMRSTGSVFDELVSPFIWTMPDGSVLKGNGLSSVNISFDKPGKYVASLNVDGNDVACEQIQVQGIPITVDSCYANVETAKAGESIKWTVVAHSESALQSYAWSSTFGDVTGNGTSATMVATSAMHKKKVSVNVDIANADGSIQTFSCNQVNVLDPESVDMVLRVGNINDQSTYGETVIPTLPDSLFLPAGVPMTVQIPSDAPSNCNIGCKPKLGSDFMSLNIYWDSDTPESNKAYFSPPGCAPGKKYSVTASLNAICIVTK